MIKRVFAFLFIMSVVFTASSQASKPPISDSLRRIEAKHKVDDLYGRIMINNVQDTGNFAAMAVLYSDDTPTAAFGGKVADYTLNGLDETIIKTVKKMKKGEIAGPLETKAGWYIIKLNGRAHKGYNIQLIFIKN